MTPTTEAPYYEEGADHINDASFQISQLVRSGSDARRLLVPIQDWAWRPKQSKLAKEIESILQTWDNPDFATRANRAQEILDELDDLWSDGNGVDMMDLGERRVPLHASSHAIERRCQPL